MTLDEQRDRLGLMCLRLIRQLPRDNAVRKDAEVLLLECGVCNLDHILRQDDYEVGTRAITDAYAETSKRCPFCMSPMRHTRLSGYVCLRCR